MKNFMKKLSAIALLGFIINSPIFAINVETITIYNDTSYPINVGMQSRYRENLRTRHDTTGKSGLTIAANETASWRYRGSIQNITVTNINNMNKNSIDDAQSEYVTIIDDRKNPGTPVIKLGKIKHPAFICPNPCPVSTTIDPAVTRDVTVIGAQGVLVQSCGTGDGCCCKSWNKKTGGEMPLTPVSKNTDGTYTLLSQNGYTRYYLADAFGHPIEGTVQLSNNFANATTWSFAEGSPNNIISDINGSIFTPLTQLAPVKSGGNSWFNWDSNPEAYEPQNFTPSGQFAGPGLVGSYDSKSQIATITDSSGKNIYTFINIKPYSQPVTPPTIMYPELNLVNIGSFPTPNWIDPRMKDGMIMLGDKGETTILKDGMIMAGSKSETTTLYGTLVSQKAPTQPVQPAPGSNPGTYGPQVFTPSQQFEGPGLVGNYFSSSKVATIHDPTQANSTSYTFDQIQSFGTGNIRPMGLTFIGTFPTPNWTPSKYSCSACPTGTTSLWGNLVPQDSAQ